MHLAQLVLNLGRGPRAECADGSIARERRRVNVGAILQTQDSVGGRSVVAQPDERRIGDQGLAQVLLAIDRPQDIAQLRRVAKRGRWKSREPWATSYTMAILKVARLGNPILRKVAEPVPPEGIGAPALQRFIDDLIETMLEYDGAGLAAP